MDTVSQYLSLSPCVCVPAWQVPHSIDANGHQRSLGSPANALIYSCCIHAGLMHMQPWGPHAVQGLHVMGLIWYKLSVSFHLRLKRRLVHRRPASCGACVHTTWWFSQSDHPHWICRGVWIPIMRGRKRPAQLPPRRGLNNLPNMEEIRRWLKVKINKKLRKRKGKGQEEGECSAVKEVDDASLLQDN